ncbi:acyl-CoA dehydrogenase family protein [Actinocrispum wychmicini]|uniref:Acyl-CoA dehydrogenase-like protein n=1 Tax=Actinocrispum wychmicini TaxID=1213861 RepID=A0A4R2K432_9PSEU|nr:acyl-CoA dehydrogenase family protein [Actinocrispum wychmicini]TCO61085.1 acyl-CoA dehydrogenase-like protein [Actinocrispum wychmicini]
MNPTGHGEAITTWLQPLRAVLDPGDRVDWTRLTALTTALDQALADHPVSSDLPAGAERSRRLRVIRHELGRRGHIDTTGEPAPFQVLAQFVCGYRDIDLRDTTGLGHGRLIAHYGSPQAQQRWIPRLVAGELAGIAVTEPHGGSRPAETRTRAVPGPAGMWLVTGCKTWISRLTEAAVFVVFFRAPDGRLTAAAVDGTEPGLRRQSIPPAGLAGWTWGVLDLDAVPIRPEDVLQGHGMALLRKHFASYRPLVTATALGGAAAIFDTVTAGLSARQASGDLPRLRDSALVTLGRAHAQLVTALLGAVVAAHLADTGHYDAELWGAAMKAHGIDTANSTAAELALLLGAAGFRADCQTAKTRRDLNGLLYADGIYDSLYRTAGKHHTTERDAAGEHTATRSKLMSVPMTA